MKSRFSHSERVEARHDEPPGLRECETAGLDPLGGRPVHHPRIGHPQRPQPLAEDPIDRAQRLPNGQEAAFLLGKEVSSVKLAQKAMIFNWTGLKYETSASNS